MLWERTRKTLRSSTYLWSSWGVYEIARVQILSQDLLSLIRTGFALLHSEESRHTAMWDSIPSIINQERFALAITNSTRRGEGGRGDSFHGGCGRSGGHGGHGCGGSPGIDRDKLHCIHSSRVHHTRDTCWDLVGWLLESTPHLLPRHHMIILWFWRNSRKQREV